MGAVRSRECGKAVIRSQYPIEKLAFNELVLDDRLVEFSGLQSNRVLKEKCALFSQNFPSKMREFFMLISPLTSFPNAEGIGAFFIHSMIEEFINSSPTNSIFATERENEIFNITWTYYKRFKMFVHDSTKLKKETRIYERKLCHQLTRVKGSLLDGNMSTPGFKMWVNGAAFHVEMLIHLVRLGDGDNLTVRAIILEYQTDIGELVREFKEFKRNCMTCFSAVAFFVIRDSEFGKVLWGPPLLEQLQFPFVATTYFHEVLFEEDSYIPRLTAHFSGILRNLDNLVELNESFDFEDIAE